MFRKLLIRRSSKSISDKLLVLTIYFPSAEDGDILPLAHLQAKDHAVNRRETRQ
jgi:hypothetical protein